MERLTFEGNFCEIAQCRELPCPYNGSCTQKEVWERLKQFEDAIQTPEKATWAKKTIEMAFSDDTSAVERLRELYKADKRTGAWWFCRARWAIECIYQTLNPKLLRMSECKEFQLHQKAVLSYTLAVILLNLHGEIDVG